MKTPEPDALRFAAEWLRQYDDTHDGGDDTRRALAVAAWLDQQADAATFRAVAREVGVSAKTVRRKAEACPETLGALRAMARSTA
jgi:response regulator of citrate/malate metabolism